MFLGCAFVQTLSKENASIYALITPDPGLAPKPVLRAADLLVPVTTCLTATRLGARAAQCKQPHASTPAILCEHRPLNPKGVGDYASSTEPPARALLQLCYFKTHDLIDFRMDLKCRPWTPESVGDYASGTNHVLPTYGYARMYSGVSLDSFQKKMTVQVVQDSDSGKERSKKTRNRAVWVAANEGLSRVSVSHIALWHRRCVVTIAFHRAT